MNLVDWLHAPAGRRFMSLPLGLQAQSLWLLALLSLCRDNHGCRSILAPAIQQALGCGRLRATALATRATVASLRYALDAVRVLHGPSAAMQRINRHHNRFEGLHHLEAAAAEGRGVVLAASFFACFYYALLCPWPAAATSLAQRRVHLVVPRLDPVLAQLCARVRDLGGRELDFIEMTQPAAAVLVARALRAGDIVICMIDNVPDGTAVSVTDFFGRPACQPAGFLLLALRTGAPVVHCGTAFDHRGFTTWFDEPLLAAAAPADEPLGWLAQRLAQQLEARVRLRPGQWTSWLSVRQKWALARSLQAS